MSPNRLSHLSIDSHIPDERIIADALIDHREWPQFPDRD
jgi:hypothetical protein